MRHLSSKYSIVAIGASAAIIATSGLAYAYWTTGGSGTGSAATGTTATVTIVQTSTVSNLYPGIAQSLSGTVTNPNTFPVQITSISVVVDPTWSSGDCDAADFTMVNPTSANFQAAVDDTTPWSGGSITLINKASENQDACKSVTVPLVYTSS